MIYSNDNNESEFNDDDLEFLKDRVYWVQELEKLNLTGKLKEQAENIIEIINKLNRKDLEKFYLEGLDHLGQLSEGLEKLSKTSYFKEQSCIDISDFSLAQNKYNLSSLPDNQLRFFCKEVLCKSYKKPQQFMKETLKDNSVDELF